MKYLLFVLTAFLLSSCASTYQKELMKSAKHGSASGRINSSASNSESILNELDQ